MAIELPQWLLNLRRSAVTDRVLNDPRSDAGTFLGVDERPICAVLEREAKSLSRAVAH